MINFMRYRGLYVLISAMILVPGIFSLARYGLKRGIDFTGGTLLELKINTQKPVAQPGVIEAKDEMEKVAKDLGIEVSSVQTSGANAYILRIKSIENQTKGVFIASVSARLGDTQETRFETVGPTLGKELLQKTFIASLVAIAAIFSYVAWAFKNLRYGVSAIVALLHDLLVVVGVFSLLGHYLGVEVDALFVTAVLTTMSFSVHDTIVVFDRIRETQKRGEHHDFGETVNTALTETMSRSVNNSLTIIFMLLALFLLGGETIRWFVFALLVGTISGTYSSPFVAAPILYTWSKLIDKRS